MDNRTPDQDQPTAPPPEPKIPEPPPFRPDYDLMDDMERDLRPSERRPRGTPS